MTERLYYEDPTLRSFDAQVIEGGTRVVLDRTAFYPTGGGQPHDTGVLNDARVTKVEEQDGRVVHELDRPLPAGPVHGEIDWDRRFDHIQQHHGQHLLSQAFHRLCQAPTVSFHLGDRECNIDLDVAGLPPDRIAQAEALANRIVREGRPVTATWFERGQVPPMDLRKLPADVARIRIVSVADFDHTPCGGTHPTRTSDVQLIKVTGSETVKKRLRLSFVCGERARTRFEERSRLIGDLCRQLHTQESSLAGELARLQEERGALFRRSRAMGLELAEVEAARLQSSVAGQPAPRVIQACYDEREMVWLGAVAERTVAAGGMIVLLGSRIEGTAQVVLARSADVDIDLRPLLQEVLPLISGKGGGRPQAVQGGGTRPEGVATAIETVFARVQTLPGRP